MLQPPLGLISLVHTLLSFLVYLQLLKSVLLQHHSVQFESFLEWLFLALQLRISADCACCPIRINKIVVIGVLDAVNLVNFSTMETPDELEQETTLELVIPGDSKIGVCSDAPIGIASVAWAFFYFFSPWSLRYSASIFHIC